MLGWRLRYGISTSSLMKWIPHASSRSSTYECVGPLRTFHPLLTSRFTFQTLAGFCFVLCFGFGGVCCFVVFLFPVLQVFGIPNSPRSLDLDDRQGFIASSAMQQKKKYLPHTNLSPSYRPGLSLWQVPPFLPPSSLSSPLFYLPFPPPSYRPGLSLWQVPPIS